MVITSSGGGHVRRSSLTPWNVIEEHLEEAEFLVREWSSTLESPTQSIADVRDGIEARLLAHIDGLDIAGDAADRQLLEPVLDDPDASEARAMAVALTLLCSRDASRGRRLVARLPELGAPLQTAVLAALAISDRADLGRLVVRLLVASTGTLRLGILDAAWRRGDDVSPALDSLLPTPDRSIEIAAARAACWADHALLAWLEHIVQSPSADLRDAAIPAALMMGSQQAWTVVGQRACDDAEPDHFAMTWSAQLGDGRELPALVQRLSTRVARPAVLWALGFSGHRLAADACLDWLGDDLVGPLAADAFAGITGLDRRDGRYWDLGDSSLPVPREAAIRQWWGEHRSGFAVGQRYILGRTADLASLTDALAIEPMRRRHAHALELLVRTRGRGRVHTRTLVRAQLRQMEEVRALPPIPFTSSFRPMGR